MTTTVLAAIGGIVMILGAATQIPTALAGLIRSLPPTIEAFRELLAELRRGSESSEEVRTEVSVADRERDSEERERDSWQEGSPRQEE